MAHVKPIKIPQLLNYAPIFGADLIFQWLDLGQLWDKCASTMAEQVLPAKPKKGRHRVQLNPTLANAFDQKIMPLGFDSLTDFVSHQIRLLAGIGVPQPLRGHEEG